MRIRSSVVILGIAAACQGANSGPAKPDQVGRPTERAGGVMGTMQQVKVAAVPLPLVQASQQIAAGGHQGVVRRVVFEQAPEHRADGLGIGIDERRPLPVDFTPDGRVEQDRRHTPGDRLEWRQAESLV